MRWMTIEGLRGRRGGALEVTAVRKREKGYQKVRQIRTGEVRE